MHLRTYVVRYQANNALAIRCGESFACVDQATRQPVDPQPPIRIEHHLDDRFIFEVAGNRCAKRTTKHARAARIRFRLNGMAWHRRPHPVRASAKGPQMG